MNALVVSVDYADILAVTLPRNRRHFDRVLVVTTPTDDVTIALAKIHNCECLQTTVFSQNDTSWFAKDAATVEGLRQLGPDGWTVLLDADIVLPQDMVMPDLEIGNLYAPRRRMCQTLDSAPDWLCYPVQRDIVFAGYCQLFHSSDPNVQPWPNYPIERLVWYSDTLFQDRWPPAKKVWLPFEVLHIGDPPRRNWCGRSPKAREHLQQLLRDPKNSKWSSTWRGERT